MGRDIFREERGRVIDYIAIVRTGIEAPRIRDAVLAETGRAGPGLVFLHGAGVELAGVLDLSPSGSPREPRDGIEGFVCSTSWQRRFQVPPPAPWRTATLVTLFDRLERAARVDSFGRGPWLSAGSGIRRDPGAGRGPPAGFGFLIEVAFAPDGTNDRTEALDFALGAAALELDARILFTGPGRAHLAGDAARGWRQIIDFELLELAANGTRDPALAVPVPGLDAHAAMQWHRDAGCVIEL